MNLKELTAPCGLACFTCAIYKENITSETAGQVGPRLGMKPEDVSCDGCRSESGCSVSGALAGDAGCPTKNCVATKGLHNCSECGEFPCENLMPGADGADTFPHNTKLYNLSRIKSVGLQAWAQEAGEIQQRYFKGKFAYGQGPVIKESIK